MVEEYLIYFLCHLLDFAIGSEQNELAGGLQLLDEGCYSELCVQQMLGFHPHNNGEDVFVLTFGEH